MEGHIIETHRALRIPNTKCDGCVFDQHCYIKECPCKCPISNTKRHLKGNFEHHIKCNECKKEVRRLLEL